MSGIRSAVFRTGFGWAGVVVSAKGVRAIVLPERSRSAARRAVAAYGPAERTGGSGPEARGLQRAVDRLRAYFAGRPARFDLSLDLADHSAFRRAVWKAAQEIPYGETRSYGWIARRISRPKAARAVGQAMGANPVAIVVP